MKKIIITESQLEMVINTLVNEQDKWNEQPSVYEQLKKVRPVQNGKYAFSKRMFNEIKNDRDIVLYLVKPNETLESIVKTLGGNSIESTLYVNDMLKNNPQNLRAGDVIAVSLRPAGDGAEG